MTKKTIRYNNKTLDLFSFELVGERIKNPPKTNKKNNRSVRKIKPKQLPLAAAPDNPANDLFFYKQKTPKKHATPAISTDCVVSNNEIRSGFSGQNEKIIRLNLNQPISYENIATGTDHGEPLPLQNSKLQNIINKAGATMPAPAENKVIDNSFNAQKEGTMIDNNFNTNIYNTEIQTATQADNAPTNANNGENNKNSNDVAPATQKAKKSKYTNFPKKDYSGFVFAHAPLNYFESVLTAYGLVFSNVIEGKIRRCGNQNEPKGDAGWYVFHQNFITTSKGEELIYLYGSYGDWSSGDGTQRINITNFDFENRNDDKEYLKEIKKLTEEARKKQAEYNAETERQLEALREEIAKKATELFNNYCDDYDCLFTAEPHSYLKNKNLFFDITNIDIKVINSSKADEIFGYRLATKKKGKFTDGEWLVIPIYNRNKNGIRSLQFIDNTGNKIMLKGGEAGGGYFEIKSNTDTNKYIISEGVADILVLNQILPNYNVIVAFSAKNLSKVVGDIVKTTPNADIVIFADRDEKSKTGETEAIKAITTAHAGRYILPPESEKDFCDFWTEEYQKNSNSDEVISIIKKYIDDALTKSFPLFRNIQRVAVAKLDFDKELERQKSKDDKEVGKIKPSSTNIQKILFNIEACGLKLFFETDTKEVEIVDYCFKKDDKLYYNYDKNKQPRYFEDSDYERIKDRLEYDIKSFPNGFDDIEIRKLRSKVEYVAKYNPYRKIETSFLNKIPVLTGEELEFWTERFYNLFPYYCRAVVNDRYTLDYYKDAAVCYFSQLYRRMVEPGTKGDYLLNLVGEQGVGKSKFVRKILPEEFFVENVPFLAPIADFNRSIAGKYLGCYEEMPGYKNADIDVIKTRITTLTDAHTRKFKEKETFNNRTCSFVFNTNNTNFLKDVTGNRRYIMIPIQDGVKTRYLEFEKDRLYLFAIAKMLSENNKKIGNIKDGDDIIENNGILYHKMDKWNKEITKDFEVENPYSTHIERWLNTIYKHNNFAPDYFVAGKKPLEFEYLKIDDVATYALDMPKGIKQNVRTKIKKALENFGYKRTSYKGIPNVYILQHKNSNQTTKENNDYVIDGEVYF